MTETTDKYGATIKIANLSDKLQELRANDRNLWGVSTNALLNMLVEEGLQAMRLKQKVSVAESIISEPAKTARKTARHLSNGAVGRINYALVSSATRDDLRSRRRTMFGQVKKAWENLTTSEQGQVF